MATLSDSSATSPEGKLGLEKAYLVVCQLESRMGHDMIHSRMALIQLHLEYTRTHEARRRPESDVVSTSTVGRGGSSRVIDGILQKIHDNWDVLDQQRQSDLRDKFHYRKKCGKRWAQLADALGRGILLLASAKLASAVKNTKVTSKMLDGIAARTKTTDTQKLKVLRVLDPLAGSLLENEGFAKFRAADILRDL
ncbi:hypothetical protein PG984_007790 [Apiospora sp. TS-2023a]